MKNNYHQTFVVVRLMTYAHVKLTLFICYLFILYKKHVKKGSEINEKLFLEEKKNQKKKKKCINAPKI